MLKRHRVASALKEKQIATIIALQTLACQHACMVEVVVLLVTGSLPRGGKGTHTGGGRGTRISAVLELTRPNTSWVEGLI